jgi:hypothetical protein
VSCIAFREGEALAVDSDGLYGSILRIRAFDGTEPDPTLEFVRGDSNADAEINLTDAVYTLQWLFLGGQPPGCLEAADCDDNGRIDLTDAVYLLNYLFRGSQAPAQPFPECGTDATPATPGCGSFAPCLDR